jgi:hypothetical protein
MDTGAMHTTSPQPLHVFYVSLLGLVCFLMSRIYMLVRFRREQDDDAVFIDGITLFLTIDFVYLRIIHPLIYYRFFLGGAVEGCTQTK